MNKIKRKKLEKLKCPYCDSSHVKPIDEDINDLYICESCNKNFIFKNRYVIYFKEKFNITLKKFILKHIKKIIASALVLLFVFCCYSFVKYYGPGIKRYFNTPAPITNASSAKEKSTSNIKKEPIKEKSTKNIKQEPIKDNTVKKSNDTKIKDTNNFNPNKDNLKDSIVKVYSILRWIILLCVIINVITIMIYVYGYTRSENFEQKEEIKSSIITSSFTLLMWTSIPAIMNVLMESF